jgi:hypothetical protein
MYLALRGSFAYWSGASRVHHALTHGAAGSCVERRGGPGGLGPSTLAHRKAQHMRSARGPVTDRAPHTCGWRGRARMRTHLGQQPRGVAEAQQLQLGGRGHQALN